LGDPLVETPEQTQASFKEAMDVFWRVKTWKLTAIFGAQITFDSLTFALHNADSEIYLIKPRGEGDDNSYPGRWFGARFAARGEADVQENTVYISFLNYGEEPTDIPIAFDGNIYYLAWFGASGSTAPWLETQNFYVERIDRLKFGFGGELLSDDPEEPVKPFYLILEPETYWPYDPGDGQGPIYDKDTGKQLRPFP
jgi:hypothetical protein